MEKKLEIERQRIDKWLWHARIVKTRTQAQKLVVSGQVRLNRIKLNSSSRQIKVGDVLTISLDHCIYVLRVVKFALRRGPATEARELYETISESRIPRNEVKNQSSNREPGSGRPTKKERRQIERFTANPAN